MNIAFIAAPVPPAPLSMLQREYYFYLFASRILTVFTHMDTHDFSRFWMLEPVHLGLLQLVSFLESKGHTCSYFAPVSPPGLEKEREERLLQKILDRASDFDLIGISCITASFSNASRIAESIRKQYPDIPLVIGGPHAWADDENILCSTDFDFVVRKEGELTTLELIEALEKGVSPHHIPGLTSKHGQSIIRTQDRPRMDRGLLPNPAYEHLEDNMNPEELAPDTRLSIPIARVTPTTGCTNNCVWCADFWKNEETRQHPDKFSEEVQYLMQKRNSRYFYLGTHNFFHDIDYALFMAETMGGISPDMHWEAQTRVDSRVSGEDMKKLASADCRCLHVGIESGNQRLLDAMGKNITLDEARRMLEFAQSSGIHTHTYWIIGSPYETRETAVTTIRTMRRWLEQGLSTCSEINLLVGYPGTRFYRHPDRYHITWQDPDFSHYDGRSTPTFETRYLTRRDIEYLFHRALDEYCEAMAGKIGSRDHVVKKLGKRIPHFDPAIMEAAF
jgi:anaerobic magnesium-protoporphyrin IX monomethyl ester cyclase